MFDRETNRNKGFGFVTFEDDDGVERSMHATGKELEGKPVSPPYGYSCGHGPLEPTLTCRAWVDENDEY